ncbi:MAG: cardiolipin synthase [Clostridia bacterium]|nr:cardiolipin synthase [Clostridia bacterium]
MKKRGIPIPTRIIISGILLLIQLVFITTVIYDYTVASTTAYAISTVLGIITVIVLINRRSNPDHKISWIVFILIFPIFGITVFLLWGGGRILPSIKKRMISGEAKYKSYLKDNDEVLESLKYHDLLHSRQAEYLTRESGYPIYNNTSTEYFSPIDNLMPRLLEELEKAEKYIFIEFFILAEGKMWDEIHKILKRKVQDGVEVKVIFDDFGSIKRQRKGFVQRLKSEKIEVAVFNPINPFMNIFMNNRNHQKIIVIDGKTAITGGFNIGDEYINEWKRFGHWMDAAILIKGDAVKSFLSLFCSMWDFATRKPIKMSKYISNYEVKADGFVIPYADDPLNDKNPAEGIYSQILNTAQKYVYITTPYLIIDNAMKNNLMMAAKSGVDVRIITPHIPDKWYVHNVTQYNYLELLESGVKIYEYTDGFIHSKLFVSDDAVATVGTVNMDYRSFVFQFECGVWICNSETVTDIKCDILNIIKRSEEINIDLWKKRPLKQRFLQAILHLFAPFM